MDLDPIHQIASLLAEGVDESVLEQMVMIEHGVNLRLSCTIEGCLLTFDVQGHTISYTDTDYLRFYNLIFTIVIEGRHFTVKECWLIDEPQLYKRAFNYVQKVYFSKEREVS